MSTPLPSPAALRAADPAVQQYVADLERRLRASQLLAEIRQELAQSLDYQTTIAHALRLLVPDMADICAIYLADAGGLQPVGLRHRDPDQEALAVELQRRSLGAATQVSLGGALLDGGVSELIGTVSPEQPAAPDGNPKEREMILALGVRSYLLLPLIARDQTLGVMSLAHTSSGRSFGPEDLPLFRDLALSIAFAIDNARLLDLAQREIDERERAIRRLSESQAIIDAIFRSSKIGMVLLAPDTGDLRMNQAFLQMVGYSAEELHARTVVGITHPDDLADELPLIDQMRSGERSEYRIEKRYIHKGGHLVMVQATATALRSLPDASELVIVIAEDISARKRAEDDLRSSEARYRSLIEDQKDLVLRRLPDGTITFVNNACCRHTGLARERLIGSSIYDLLHPDDREAVRERVTGFSNGGQRVGGISRMRHADGSYRWYEWTGSLFFDSLGQIAELQSVGRDITARQVAEDKHRWLAAILETTPDLVGYMGIDGRLEYMNAAGRQICGLPESWQPGQPTANGGHPLARNDWLFTTGIPAALRDGMIREEVLFRDATGEARPFSQLVLALRDSSGRVARLATIARDLRAQRQAEASRIALERKLVEAQKLESLGVLAGGIAHDFNNILAAVLGYAELSLLEAQLSDDTRHSLGMIVTGVQRAADLTREILAYAGKGQVLIQAVSWHDLLREMSDLLQASITKHCQIVYRLAAELPLVEADVAQLRQILLNLLVNAAEAIGEAGGTITLVTGVDLLQPEAPDDRSAAAAPPPGPYVRLEVSDDGVGMAPETLARIFDPFFTTKFTGRGLGLAAVQGIVRSHRGVLHVKSALGAGTSFTIWLPAYHSSAPAAAAPTPPARRLLRGAVLVIDDEPAVCAMAVRMLERLGLSATSAPDGQRGLEALRDGPADLIGVLLDLTMPLVGGAEVAQAIQALRPGTPIVLMSGYSADHLADQYAAIGLATFLQKPFSLEALRSAVLAMLGSA